MTMPHTRLVGICRHAVLSTLLLVLLAAAVTAPAVSAETAESCPLWIVSTRSAPTCSPNAAAAERLRYWRWDQPTRKWIDSNGEAFHRSDDPQVPTAVFIHGNRSSFQDAVRAGWAVHRRLCRLAAGQPLRVVIWSWPADRVRGGARHDAQVKAARSDVQAYYLALWIDRLDARQRLNLIGYSFGARVIAGAGQLLGGGQLAGHRLPRLRPADQRPTCRVVLVAAAVDDDTFLPGRHTGLALEQFDRVLITQNACDPVLRLYHRMDRCRSRQALGRCGPARGCGPEAPDAAALETLDVTCSVGRNHSWAVYLAAPALQAWLARCAFLKPPQAEVETTQRSGLSVSSADSLTE